MTQLRIHFGFLSLVFVALCLVPACMDDAPTVGKGSQSSEPTEQTSPAAQSSPAEESSNEIEAATCTGDGGCQPTGVHCCTGNRLFAPLDCNEDPGTSGYVCGTCIPSNFCQPTGDHCCTAQHFFNPGRCGGTADGKPYSGYVCE